MSEEQLKLISDKLFKYYESSIRELGWYKSTWIPGPTWSQRLSLAMKWYHIIRRCDEELGEQFRLRMVEYIKEHHRIIDGYYLNTSV